MWFFRLILLPFKIALLPVHIGLLLARVLGYNRFVVFLLGVAVGLLVAPTTGAELRARLRDEIAARTGGALPPDPEPPAPAPAAV